MDTRGVSRGHHLIKSPTYEVQFDGAEDNTMGESENRGSEDGEETRGSRSAPAGVDSGSTRKFALKISDNARDCDIGYIYIYITQTKRKVWSVERINGRIC